MAEWRVFVLLAGLQRAEGFLPVAQLCCRAALSGNLQDFSSLTFSPLSFSREGGSCPPIFGNWARKITSHAGVL